MSNPRAWWCHHHVSPWWCCCFGAKSTVWIQDPNVSLWSHHTFSHADLGQSWMFVEKKGLSSRHEEKTWGYCPSQFRGFWCFWKHLDQIQRRPPSLSDSNNLFPVKNNYRKHNFFHQSSWIVLDGFQLVFVPFSWLMHLYNQILRNISANCDFSWRVS